MREAANTVREAGFDPFMAAAIADKQQWVADQAAAGVFDDLAQGRALAGLRGSSAGWRAEVPGPGLTIRSVIAGLTRNAMPRGPVRRIMHGSRIESGMTSLLPLPFSLF